MASCACWEFTINRLRLTPWYWYLAVLLTSTAFGFANWINYACNFVVLVSFSDNVTITRGTQGGQLLPLDTCQSWGRYDGLQLDSNMKTVRVSASLTIFLGAFLLIILGFYPFILCRIAWMRATAKWMAAIFAVLCALFQALTHLMVKSELCLNSNLVLSGVYQCLKDTPPYRATYFTVATYAVSALLITFLPVDIARDEEDHDEERDEERAAEDDRDGTEGGAKDSVEHGNTGH